MAKLGRVGHRQDERSLRHNLFVANPASRRQHADLDRPVLSRLPANMRSKSVTRRVETGKEL